MTIRIALPQQLVQMAVSLGLGLCAGLLYDALRTLRLIFRIKAVEVLLDILYWSVCFVLLFTAMMSLFDGNARLFMLVFFAIGAVLYFATVSIPVRKLFEAVSRLCRFILGCALYPLRLLYYIIKKFSEFCKKIFHYTQIWYRIRCNSIMVDYCKRLLPGSGQRRTHETEKVRNIHKDTHRHTDNILRLGTDDNVR